MAVTLFLIALATSVVGAICGIGGGVLIKPMLDAMKIMDVSSISFLAGCTVLAMAVVSVAKNLRRGRGGLDKHTLPLALGAAVGGVAGKWLFGFIRDASGNEALVGLLQAVLLGLLTLGTLFYMLAADSGRIKTRHLKNMLGCAVIGLLLGVASSFLGIGGGPFNLAVLSFCFSMDAKEEAANSLCIIFFSQLASLGQTLLTGTTPPVNIWFLVCMVAGGLAGGLLGHRLNTRLRERQVRYLFDGLLVVVTLVCVLNAARFAALL